MACPAEIVIHLAAPESDQGKVLAMERLASVFLRDFPRGKGEEVRVARHPYANRRGNFAMAFSIIGVELKRPGDLSLRAREMEAFVEARYPFHQKGHVVESVQGQDDGPPAPSLNPAVFRDVLGRPGWKTCTRPRTYKGTEEQRAAGLRVVSVTPEVITFENFPGVHETVLGILDDPSRPLMPNCETRFVARHSGYVWYAVDQSWFDYRYIVSEARP